MWPIVPSLMT